MSETVESYRLPLDAHLDKLEKIVKENPDDPSSLMAFGEMAFRRGKNLIALAAFHRLMEMKPDVVDVHLALTKIYGEQKMYDEAFRELAEAFKLDKSNVEAKVLYDILSQVVSPSEPFNSQIKELLPTLLSPHEIDLYILQLSEEKGKLAKDIEELSSLLDASPMDTILEYNKNIALRRQALIEEFLARASELKEGKPMEPSVKTSRKTSAPKQEEKFSPTVDASPLSDQKKAMIWLVGALDPIMQNIKKTKGITAVFVAGIGGKVYHSLVDERVNPDELMEAVHESLNSLWLFSPDFMDWILEFPQCLLGIQTIAPKLFLLITAETPTTSFGALLYMMEENYPLVSDVLRSVEVSKLES